MPQLKARNNNTGEVVTFNWYGDEPPTEADLAEVFAAKSSAPKKDERTWTDTAIDALPVVGGIAGGMAGAALGPLAIGTAAIGGAGGEGFRRAIQTLRGKRPVDASTSETVQGLAKAGAQQGAAQAVGMGVGKGLQSVGKGAMRMAFGAQKPLRTKFPTVDLESVALREGIGPGQSKAAQVASRAANQAVEDAARAADAAGVGGVRPQQMLPGLRKLYDRYNRARMTDSAAQVARDAAETVKSIGAGMSNADALILKQELQALAKGTLQGATDPRSASVAKKIARAKAGDIAGALRSTDGVGKALDRSQEMMMLQKAVESAANHTPMLRALLPVAGAGTGYASGGSAKDAATGALGAYMLTQPRNLSLLARGANASAPIGRELARLLTLLAQERDK